EAGDSGGDAEADVLGDVFGGVSIAGLEVGVDGEIDGVNDGADVLKGEVAGEGPFGVGESEGEGEAGTGGGQSFEAKVSEVAGSPDVPRVGDDEETGFMEFSEGCSAGGEDLWIHRFGSPLGVSESGAGEAVQNVYA